jgi:hypothetical protein
VKQNLPSMNIPTKDLLSYGFCGLYKKFLMKFLASVLIMLGGGTDFL